MRPGRGRHGAGVLLERARARAVVGGDAVGALRGDAVQQAALEGLRAHDHPGLAQAAALLQHELLDRVLADLDVALLRGAPASPGQALCGSQGFRDFGFKGQKTKGKRKCNTDHQ